MLNLIPAVALIFLAHAPGAEQNQKVVRLRDVSSVYVAELGKTIGKDAAELGRGRRTRRLHQIFFLTLSCTQDSYFAGM